MPLIQKNDVNQIFAEQAPPIDKPATFANYPRGWDESRKNNGKPLIKQFNYLQQRTDQNILWIHQNGAGLPYDENIEYAEGAPVVKDGELVQKAGLNWKPVQGSDVIKSVESIADLLAIQNPKDGKVVFVKSYNQGQNEGGDNFVFKSSRIGISDGVFNFSGWGRVLSSFDISVEMGGVIGGIDGASGDADKIQNMVKILYPETIKRHQTGLGFELSFNGTKTYNINKPVLLPRFSKLNGGRALLIGINREFDCFVSAKWKNGDLVDSSNTGIGGDTYESWSSIENFQFTKFKKNVHLFGWTMHCYLRFLSSLDSEQHIVSREHYFLTIENCSSDWTGKGTGLANYDLGVYSGMITLNNLSASSCDVGYRFYLGAQAVTMNKLDAESVGTAIIVDGSNELGGVLVTGGYFENCNIVLDTTRIGPVGATVDIQNSFINGSDTIVCKATGGNGSFIGKQESNYLRKYKTWVEDLSANSLSKTEKLPILVAYDVIAPNSPNSPSTDTNLYLDNNPYFWCKNTHKQTITSYRPLSGKTQAIHEHYFGVIPANYYGYQGAPDTDIVPFCLHEMTTPTDGVLDIVVTTAIRSGRFTSGVFVLELETNTTVSGMLSGRFYQNKATIDVNDKNVTLVISTVNDVIVFTIKGLTGASYYCTGFIKLI